MRFSGVRLIHALLALLLVSLFYAGSGCSLHTHGKSIVVATTSSLYDSGALDRIIAAFERLHKVSVKPIPTGSGEALRLGRMGEADLVITHAPKEEEKFIKRGYGFSRIPFLKTEYVLVGPKDDPADTANASSMEEAFSRIGRKGSLFVSRGDNSGTHLLELDIWRAVGTKPAGKPWYMETGQGMGETLFIANQKEAYCLADLCTFLSLPHLEALSVAFQPDPPLECVYTAIVVDTRKLGRGEKNIRKAKRFADFLLSSECRKLVLEFKVKGMGLYMPFR